MTAISVRLFGSLLAVLAVSAEAVGDGLGVPLRVPVRWLDTAGSYSVLAGSLVVASATPLLVPVLLFDRRGESYCRL